MIKLHKFDSDLAAPLDERFPKMPYQGKGWHVTFGKKVKFSDGSITFYSSGKASEPRHILIHATNQLRAKNALSLILAASCLLSGDYGADTNRFKEINIWKNNVVYDVDASPSISDWYQPACLVSARASYRKSFQYAIEKYNLSQQCFPTSVNDLDPYRWQPKKKVYNFAQHHVRCAQAIILGYSAIEELGLEVRASQKNPSFIMGKWNLSVKEDLEKRLIKAGINLEEKISWVIRNTPTKIEKERQIPKLKKSFWSYAKIRDSEIEIVDAIALASWIRSKISAHRLNELSSSLSYDDVANIHFVSRRLILESLSMWRLEKFGEEV